MSDLLRTLIHNVIHDLDPGPFAVLRREEGPGVEVLLGDVVDVDRLADIPLVQGDAPGPQVLAMVPYRQITERGFVCHDDKAPLRCLLVRESEVLDLDTALDLLPDAPVEVTGRGFDIDDGVYADMVGRVVRDEIGRGEGANFVIRRDYLAHTPLPAHRAALALVRRLLLGEPGAYWTFAVHAGDRTMVGATPERHVSVLDGQVLMNPISGTYRYPAEGPSADGLRRFLDDPKETDELFMVVDEELKMMSQICDRGGQVLGPYLKQMSALAHTEYLLTGRTELDVRDVLRETMFAATVTGSPVQNAARVITRHERAGRGYYSGVLALIGADQTGQRTLDAPILIRTAHLDDTGEIRVPVGATLVRHSVPEHEVAETHAKAAGVLRALGVVPAGNRPRHDAPPLIEEPGIAAALARRNESLAEFWLRPQHDRPVPELLGRTALIVDAEDAWTAMLAHLLRRLGMSVMVRRWDDAPDPAGFDLLVAGPGPGDPRELNEPRMARLRQLIEERLAAAAPLLAVCLSHQILAGVMRLPLRPLPSPYQGKQRRIDLFDQSVQVGFYNTYTAVCDGPLAGVTVAADPATGEIHALRGPGFASVQFHLESLLSTDGVDILAGLAAEIVGARLSPGAKPAR
ncbi:MAG TPA: anthranilate synthase family protein [Mycobacteriales bacterium]|nr:anthranilate synthase family protein [Mycobacteriales bacterium]